MGADSKKLNHNVPKPNLVQLLSVPAVEMYI